MKFTNEIAPEGSQAAKEDVKVLKVEYTDGTVEYPYDEALKKKTVVRADGTVINLFEEAKSFWKSPAGLKAIKKARFVKRD
jgi:hypothetical protein